jgi:hypothetical protein
MTVIAFANVALLFAFCIHSFQRRKELNDAVTRTYGILELLIMTCLVAIIFGAVLVANFQHFPMLPGDQWRHNGIASLMLNGQLPAYPGNFFLKILIRFSFTCPFSTLFR